MSHSNTAKIIEPEYRIPKFITESEEKVRIRTKTFGETPVCASQIFSFPDGILGFNYVNGFAFLQEDGAPFIWMQALNEPDLSFVTIEPESFIDSYDLAVSQSDLDCVNEKNIENVKVLFIVTIPQNPSEMTVNLQGPVILNLDARIGRQAINLSDKYKTRHSILDEMNKRGK